MNRSIALGVAGFAVALVLFASPPAALATVRVPALIGNHMMLQRGRPVRLWGTAAPGESIRATLAGGKAATRADAGGQWGAHASRGLSGRSLRAEHRGLERAHLLGRLVGRGLGGLGSVQHGIHIGPVQGRRPGGGGRLSRAASVHRGQGDSGSAQGRCEWRVASLRRGHRQGLLCRGLSILGRNFIAPWAFQWVSSIPRGAARLQRPGRRARLCWRTLRSNQ